MKMFIKGDYDNAIDLTRRYNALGLNAKTFTTADEARNHAYGLNANEADHDEHMQSDARGSADAAPVAELPAVAVEIAPAAPVGGGEVLHPSSGVKEMRARLKEPGAAIYGTKEELWTRLSKAESAQKAHCEHLEELRERHQKAAEGQPSIAARTVAAANQPSAEERAMHDMLHMMPAAWCESCIR